MYTYTDMYVYIHIYIHYLFCWWFQTMAYSVQEGNMTYHGPLQMGYYKGENGIGLPKRPLLGQHAPLKMLNA